MMKKLINIKYLVIYKHKKIFYEIWILKLLEQKMVLLLCNLM